MRVCARVCACVSVLECGYSVAVVKVPSSVEGDHTTQLPHSTPRPHEQYPQSDTSTSEHHQEDDEHDLESVPQRVPPTASAPTIHSLAVSHTHNTQGEEEGRDQELVQLEMQLETWCGDMKRNILVGSVMWSRLINT